MHGCCIPIMNGYQTGPEQLLQKVIELQPGKLQQG